MNSRRDADCIFCRIITGESPATPVYEDEHTLAFMDIHPQAPGHVLVIPKRHVAMIYDLGDELAARVMHTVVRVARGMRRALEPTGIRLVQSNGRSAGQVVMHLHVHLIPAGTGELPAGRTSDERARLAEQIRQGIAQAEGD